MNNKDLKNQVKSKERVNVFGEVNTSEKEVNAMLDLVRNETNRIDSRFLEPACGDGNFLIKVLERKFNIIVDKYKSNQYEFEKNSIIAVGSVYGIDILEDNAKRARQRLFFKFVTIYERLFGKYLNQDLVKSIKFIINKNIIHGDALTLKQANSENPVTFCEWGILNNKLKRRDFTLAELLEYAPFEEGTLFHGMEEEVMIMPKPIKEHAIVNYDKAFETC